MRDVLLITGGIVADANTAPCQRDVLVRDGRIVTVGTLGEDTLATLRAVPGIEELDASGCFVLPGGVDPHTHFELTTSTHVADDFTSGTLAALHGGTTSIIEHPGFAPSEESHDLLYQMRRYRKLAEGKCHVDYGLHLVFQPPQSATIPEKKEGGDYALALPPGHDNGANPLWPALSGLPEAVKQGYASGKAYMTYDGKLDDSQLLSLMCAMKRAGCLLTVHAENDAMPAWFMKYGGLPDKASSFPRSRPPQCEAEAVTRVLALARCVSLPVYVVHVSTAAALHAIREARKSGQIVYAETCPQYLLLTEAAYTQGEADGIRYIMAPPLRSLRDVDALWQALLDGSIDVVATDHCAFSLAQKKAASSVWATPGGIPGVETRLPLLFTHGVLRHGLDMQRFSALVSGNPARIFGMETKGTLTPGADADIVVLDPDMRRELKPQHLHQRVDFCPFSQVAPYTATGWPRYVILRGQVLIRTFERPERDSGPVHATGDTQSLTGRFISRRLA